MTCSVALVYLTTGLRLIRRWGRETAAVSYSSFTHHHTLPDALCFVGPTKRGGGLGQQVIAAAVDPLIFRFLVVPLEI
jgi:hypothetical protein